MLFFICGNFVNLTFWNNRNVWSIYFEWCFQIFKAIAERNFLNKHYNHCWHQTRNQGDKTTKIHIAVTSQLVSNCVYMALCWTLNSFSRNIIHSVICLECWRTKIKGCLRRQLSAHCPYLFESHIKDGPPNLLQETLARSGDTCILFALQGCRSLLIIILVELLVNKPLLNVM